MLRPDEKLQSEKENPFYIHLLFCNTMFPTNLLQHRIVAHNNTFNGWELFLGKSFIKQLPQPRST